MRVFGDCLAGVRVGFREHMIQLMGEHAGQRASKKYVGPLIVAAPHSGVQRRSNLVAFDFAERQYDAIRTIGKREWASFIVKIRDGLHPTLSPELDYD